ncbi:hypothetical protein D915_001057 [Fasciola hepatica]|uniref:Uncharacterized protein n=1 Tax=Fasciola hepatica TaxID=6192 RepID=A0A2H1CTR5_FASHE|nr:hypothetical protein D915_001057 [Fasciola hepatica]
MSKLAFIVPLGRQLYTSCPLSAAGIFRARRRLPPSNTEWGPLTDLPDYTVLGKASPVYTSEGQRKRAIRNYLFSKDVVTLTKNMMNITGNPRKLGTGDGS